MEVYTKMDKKSLSDFMKEKGMTSKKSVPTTEPDDSDRANGPHDDSGDDEQVLAHEMASEIMAAHKDGDPTKLAAALKKFVMDCQGKY